jgi:hypothetical protein
MLTTTFIKYQVMPHTFASFLFPWRFQPPCHCSPSLKIQVVLHNLRQTLTLFCHSTLIKWWHAPHSFTTNLYTTLSFNNQLVTSISHICNNFPWSLFHSTTFQSMKVFHLFFHFFLAWPIDKN